MSKKLAICVPHYKRKEHLKKFVPHMDKFFKNKDFRIVTYMVTAFILSFLLSFLITGSKYGIYDYLPHHYLFENPYDYRDGDIFGNYFVAIGP